MRASLWCLLPSDGEFQSAPNGHHYYLARQGRRVVLRGGDVKAPLPSSRINWNYDPRPNQPSRVTPRQAVPGNINDTVPRNNIQQKGKTNQVHNKASSSSLPPKRKRDRKHRRERRARERKYSHLFMMRAGPISAH